MKGVRERIEEKRSVIEMDRFVEGFDYTSVDKENAKLLLQYAKERHGLLVHDGECIDAKADLLVKYLGLIPPALAALISYLGPLRNGHLSCLLLVGLVVGIVTWLAALYFPLCAAKPDDMPYPSTIEALLPDAKKDRPVEMVLALKYEQSAVAIKELGIIKSEKMDWGYRLMFVSIALLFACLLAGTV